MTEIETHRARSDRAIERARPFAMCLALALLLAAAAVRAAQPELLEPEQAFRFAARLKEAGAIEVRYRIAPGYYMYRDKFRFAASPEAVRLGAPKLPPGVLRRDEFFGEVETYRGEVAIEIPFAIEGAAVPEFTLIATSQGCADVGVCYTPQEQKAQLRLAAIGAPPAGLFDAVAGASDDAVASLFASGFWLVVASFFGFGLLLAFTPCMLPMVPILSGAIAGHGRHLTRRRGLALAASFVLGMALTYAIAGVAAGLSGAMLSAALQHPVVLGAFAAVFVVLALSMFGLYELQLPASLQSRIAEASRHFHGGHVLGVFSMGVLSALVIGPCVAAPLAGALLYIGRSGDVVLGGAALFAMALGLGTPLLALGASAGALVPKAGPWMETVKRFFGVLLLAVAIYILSPVIPLAVQMLLWAGLLILTGIFLRALDPLPEGAHGFERVCKGLGVIALVAGVAYLVGALSGARDPLQPLAGLRAGAPEAAPSAPPRFERVSTLAELDARVKAAAGRPVMLDFYADWCVSCKELERYTFSDARVQERLREMVLLQADVTANSSEDRALLRRFRLFGPPGIVFFDRAGHEIPGLRVIGFQSAERFAEVLDRVLAYR
jgi:thiol:disulfide interchange protein DsbD